MQITFKDPRDTTNKGYVAVNVTQEAYKQFIDAVETIEVGTNCMLRYHLGNDQYVMETMDNAGLSKDKIKENLGIKLEYLLKDVIYLNYREGLTKVEEKPKKKTVKKNK